MGTGMGTAVTPLGAVASLYRHYADFNGRSPRSAVWWVLAYLVAVEAVAFAMLAVILGPAMQAAAQHATPPPLPTAAFVVGGVLLIWVLATLVPYLALLVRRMHDLDKSGFMLLVYFIPWSG